jgi:hypothetical protein
MDVQVASPAALAKAEEEIAHGVGAGETLDGQGRENV